MQKQRQGHNDGRMENAEFDGEATGLLAISDDSDTGEEQELNESFGLASSTKHERPGGATSSETISLETAADDYIDVDGDGAAAAATAAAQARERVRMQSLPSVAGLD